MNYRVREAGSASSIPQQREPQIPTDTTRTDGMRGGDAEPDFTQISDPLLRAAVEAAYEGWARTYPHLVEDWSA